jgi:uncharacterized protein YraI
MRSTIKPLFALVLVAGLALPVAWRPADVAARSCGPCPGTTTAALNLRAGPSLSDEVLLVMPAGASVEWDNFQGEVNGYVAVTYDGVSGWAHRDYLQLYPGFATTTAGLNLRSDPSLDAGVILVMPAGSQVTTLGGPTNGYYSVDYNGTVGWAHGAFLAFGESGPVEDGFPTGTTVVVNTDALNLRDAPGLSGGVLDVLPWGAQGAVLEPPVPADGYVWYRVDFDSSYGVGWVAGGFLASGSSGGGFGIGDMVVVVDGPLNYRTDPAIGAEVLEVLPEGTEGAILDGPVYADGWTWYQIGLPGYGPDGQTPGWAAGEFLGWA